MTKREVLKVFKALHRARLVVFKDDQNALAAGRKKINEEFLKCKNVKDPESINELINLGYSVEKELRTSVIQAYEKKPGLYELRITKDTKKFDNIPAKNKCSK